MQVRIIGEMTLFEIRHALFEKIIEIELETGLKYSRGATLFLNPSNGFGDDVTPRRRTGEKLTRVYSHGPYRSVADELKI